MEPVRLIAYSDYLCPWCYNGSVRLRGIAREYSDRVQLEYRSFLLRPRAEPGRDLEKFRAYTQSWRRPDAEDDSGSFQVWQGDAGPPSHSIPAHLVAKAAARLGLEAFWAMHERLLAAYFSENQDISNTDTLAALWKDVGLDSDAFAAHEDPALLRQVIDEHNSAIELGVSGVPSVMIAGQDVPIAGAQPLALYRRWLDRVLSGEIALTGQAGSPS